MTRPLRCRPDPAARHAVAAREYQSSPDGGTTWDECTRLDVESSVGCVVYRALRDGKVRAVTSMWGILYRRRA